MPLIISFHLLSSSFISLITLHHSPIISHHPSTLTHHFYTSHVTAWDVTYHFASFLFISLRFIFHSSFPFFLTLRLGKGSIGEVERWKAEGSQNLKGMFFLLFLYNIYNILYIHYINTIKHYIYTIYTIIYTIISLLYHKYNNIYFLCIYFVFSSRLCAYFARYVRCTHAQHMRSIYMMRGGMHHHPTRKRYVAHAHTQQNTRRQMRICAKTICFHSFLALYLHTRHEICTDDAWVYHPTICTHASNCACTHAVLRAKDRGFPSVFFHIACVSAARGIMRKKVMHLCIYIPSMHIYHALRENTQLRARNIEVALGGNFRYFVRISRCICTRDTRYEQVMRGCITHSPVQKRCVARAHMQHCARKQMRKNAFSSVFACFARRLCARVTQFTGMMRSDVLLHPVRDAHYAHVRTCVNAARVKERCNFASFMLY